MERYREYKDSGEQWLGEIPSHWDFLYLRVLLKENSIQNSEGNVTSQLQFKYGSIIKKDNQDVDSDVIDTISKYTIVLPGDIVINGLNLNYDFVSQRIGQVEELGVITSAYICLRPTNYANRKYLLYLLKAMDGIKLFHGMGTGVRMTLSYKELKNKRLPVPPLSEQTAMVAYLDRVTVQIDKAIAQQQRMIDLLNERKQIIIQHAVTKGLDPNAEMVDSGVEWIGEMPKGWKIEPFGKHFSFHKGLTITKENLQDEGIAVINYGQIHSKTNSGTSISEELIRRVPPKYLKTNPQSLLKMNDFVFADTSEDISGSGNFVFNDYQHKIFAGYHTIIARPYDLLYPKYYAYLFKSQNWKNQVQSLVNGVKVYSIGKRIIKSSYILFPTEREQHEIVDYLDNIVNRLDKSVSYINNTISLLRERKKIIINEVVTGKVKVS